MKYTSFELKNHHFKKRYNKYRKFSLKYIIQNGQFCITTKIALSKWITR